MLKICQWISNNSMYPWYTCTGHVARRDKQLMFDWVFDTNKLDYINICRIIITPLVIIIFEVHSGIVKIHWKLLWGLLPSDFSALSDPSYPLTAVYCSLYCPETSSRASCLWKHLCLWLKHLSLCKSVMWPPLALTQNLNFSCRITFPSLMPSLLVFFHLIKYFCVKIGLIISLPVFPLTVTQPHQSRFLGSCGVCLGFWRSQH